LASAFFKGICIGKNRHRQTLKESALAKFADTKADADSLSIRLQELHSML